VDLLLRKGYSVRVLDNLEPGTHMEGRPPWTQTNAEFIHGDMRSLADLEKSLSGVDAVIHQAAYGGFAPELTKMTDVNACGTARIFEVIRTKRLDIKKVVTASSQAVYGEGKYSCASCGVVYPELRPVHQLRRGQWEHVCPGCGDTLQPMPIAEDTPLRINGVYALSKYYEERLTLSLGNEWGIPSVALRYMLTYGPRQSIFNPYTGICSIFSTRLLNGVPPVLYEDGQQTRDFVFVEDVAAANVQVLENDAANGGVFNVGTGVATTVSDFARILRDAYGVSVDAVVPGEFRALDFRHLVADNARLRALGWAPRVPVREGVRRYAEWIRSMPHPAEYFSKAEQILKQLRVIHKVG
jgi:dTDP-L-rhamnose 4-epimerase